MIFQFNSLPRVAMNKKLSVCLLFLVACHQQHVMFMGSAHSQKNWHASGNSLAICGKHDLYSPTVSLCVCEFMSRPDGQQQKLLLRASLSAPNTKEHKKADSSNESDLMDARKMDIKMTKPCSCTLDSSLRLLRIEAKTASMHYKWEMVYAGLSRQSSRVLLLPFSLLLDSVNLT